MIINRLYNYDTVNDICGLKVVPGELSLLYFGETLIVSLGVVSKSAALFCSSPLFTQWEYILNAQLSINFLINLFSYGDTSMSPRESSFGFFLLLLTETQNRILKAIP